MHIILDKPKEYYLERLNKHSVQKYNCRVWFGTTTRNGYGQIRINKTLILTHRLSAFIHFNFDINNELFILHKNECPNKTCWIPEHIYEGDHQQNMIDKGDSITHCPQGHEYTKKNINLYRGYKTCKECNRIRAANFRKRKLSNV